MPMPLQNPEQELRFTRARQAVPFWLLAAVLVATAVTVVATIWFRDFVLLKPELLWALAPFAAAVGCGKLAWRLTKHAYVILTPLGVEIFPFFRPERGMQVLYWQEVSDAEADSRLTRLTLHRDKEHTSGIHLALGPIPVERRGLLVEAVMRRLNGDAPQAD